ncbi:hypothetical protein [Alloacidobacterium sp.]|uniref:hypothetical protein n=1 Tax=Alloacidobacterium sp. TaxID=2951999 RepID=UPI002D603207|nr:hypothetical protein [Alloacidobacterium sp.]HYK37891.1 hypothetical protein [Alloacidobacterium sp.]
MHRRYRGGQECFGPREYAPGARVLALCLLFAVLAWDYTATVLNPNELPALFCKRLAHHATDSRMCCPLPVSLPARRTQQNKCCEAPAPTQDAVPSAKQSGASNAACCALVTALAPSRRTASLPPQLHRGRLYEREVFDLKDMRI